MNYADATVLLEVDPVWVKRRHPPRYAIEHHPTTSLLRRRAERQLAHARRIMFVRDRHPENYWKVLATMRRAYHGMVWL